MHLCPNCAAEVIPGAKFCHRCGDKFAEKTKPCPACREQNPLASVFCHHCGFHYEGKNGQARAYTAQYAIDFKQADIAEQVKALFFRSLRSRVAEEHDINRYSDFVERFYRSRFKEVYEVRAEQIADDVLTRWERFGTEGLPEIDRRLENAFDGLMDYFIIQFCPDLHGFVLPETILKYEHGVQNGKTDLWQMIRDFLDFDREDETIYLDFVTMPEEYLSNACKHFLFAGRREKVFFICDLSLKGNCKEGFAMTDKGMYWRAPFDKPRQAQYADLADIKRNREWLTINGNFFTANPALNLKMYKLLKKMRGYTPAASQTQRVF